MDRFASLYKGFDLMEVEEKGEKDCRGMLRKFL